MKCLARFRPAGIPSEVFFVQSELLTLKEVALYLRSTTRAVHKWTRLKTNPLPVLYAGSKPLFDPAAVRSWLETRQGAK